MPGHTTNEQMEKRVEDVVKMLAQFWRMGAIKHALRKKYGPLSHQACHRYACRARERMIKESGRSKEDWTAQSLAAYSAIISNPKSPFSVKVQAIARIDSVLGLEASKRPEAIEQQDGGRAQYQALVEAAAFTPEEMEKAIRTAFRNGHVGENIPGLDDLRSGG